MKSLDLLKKKDLIKIRERENEKECLRVYLYTYREESLYSPSMSYVDQQDCTLQETLIKKSVLHKTSIKMIGFDCLNLA